MPIDDTRTTVFDWRWGHFTFIFFSPIIIDSAERMNAKRARQKWNHSDLQFMYLCKQPLYFCAIYTSQFAYECLLPTKLWVKIWMYKRLMQEKSRFEFKIDWRTFHKKFVPPIKRYDVILHSPKVLRKQTFVQTLVLWSNWFWLLFMDGQY